MFGWLSRVLTRLLPAPPEIGPGEDVVFVDVRTRREFEAGHAEGAIHIPFNQMPDRWDELEPHRDRRLLVYCLSGHRSGAALKVLRERGFDRAENGGGIGGLRRAGIPVVRAAP